MSPLAEFARELHETSANHYIRTIEPIDYPSRSEKLTDIRAAIFDIYGTLVNYWRPGLDAAAGKQRISLEAFRGVADRFGLSPYLTRMNPSEPPEKTLYDLYHGLIALNHEKEVKKGTVFPEIKIEEVWSLILLMLKRRGYEPRTAAPECGEDVSRYCAFYYNFLFLGRELYPGVVKALAELKKNNILLGIVSNAQFYAPIDLTLFIRDQSGGTYIDMGELFEADLTFYSYESGVAKPNALFFRRLYDALYEFEILPRQTVFIGNDLTLDIEPAASAGMRTALFTGDRMTTYLHDNAGVIIPDISFATWTELPDKVSFHSERTESP